MATTADTCPANPLLYSGLLPKFDEVKAEHVVPGVRSLLAQLDSDLTALEASVSPSWASIAHMERLADALGRPWSVVSHLKAVRDSEPLRAAYDEVNPERVALSLRFAQSKPLYAALKALRESADWPGLSPAQQRVVEAELRDATLSGVGLDGAAKERFNELSQELSKLSTTFSNNVLDATKAFEKLVTAPEQVAGLPPSALALAAQTAAAKGHAGATPESGPWVFTLDIPSYMAVMSHASFRPLREELYRAYLTRASAGDADNSPVILQILMLKAERAKLLGFAKASDVSFASKMATLESAEALLAELRDASKPAAERELAEVNACAAAAGAAEASEPGGLKHWDVTYWAERLREQKFAFTEEELRPYFQLPRVLEGIFSLVSRLFAVKVEAADGEAPVWHPDVRFFKITDPASGEPLAYFYLDPYSRPAEKRGGAWMDEVAR